MIMVGCVSRGGDGAVAEFSAEAAGSAAGLEESTDEESEPSGGAGRGGCAIEWRREEEPDWLMRHMACRTRSAPADVKPLVADAGGPECRLQDFTR